MSKKNIIRTFSVLMILLVGFISMNFLSSAEKESNKRDVQPEVRTVATEMLEYNDISLTIDGNGLIVPQRSLQIISEAGGRIIFAKNNLKDGTYFQQDEIVLKIDSREVENTLFSLRSDFLNTVASLLPELKADDQTAYKKWYAYFQGLEIDKEIPELPKVENSQEKIMVSTRNIYTKYFNVKNQEILLSKYSISAPFEGFIASNGIIENSFVSRGQLLFTINDVKNLEVSVPLLLDDYNKIEFAHDPLVKIYPENNPEEVITGKIIRKETKLEKNSQTVNVFVSLVNRNLNSYFFPGNYVNVEIEGENLTNVAVIPRHVIYDQNSVFTMEDGRLNKRNIRILAFQRDKVIIDNSLPKSVKIITTLMQKPLIGMELKDQEMVAAADTLNLNPSAQKDEVAILKD